MAAVHEQIPDRLFSSYRTGFKLAFLFDYDGTIKHRGQVRPAAAARDILACLARHPRVIVGIISDRLVDDLKNLMDLDNVCYGGAGHLEVEWKGRRVLAPFAERARESLTQISPVLQHLAARHPGVWIEKRNLSLTLHHPELAFDHAEVLRAETAQLLGGRVQPLRCVVGPTWLRITSTLSGDRGTAVGAMLRLVGPPVLPLFAGGIDIDPTGWEAVNSLGGVSVAVGSTLPPSAQLQFSSADSLLASLATLSKLL